MNAIDILKDFMCEMHIWETSFCKAQDEYDEADHDTKELCGVYREKLKVILEKYSMETTPNRDRLVDLGCTVPATYTPTKIR
ncbi:hypothetical protein DK254_08250 [Pseudomonas sp. RW407]|nr:hypothetical protein DK254_08250 [Pseudomonas sp. RW407]